MPNVYKFEQAVCYLDGTSILGHVNEIELPELSWATSDHETIGFIGTPQFASKLEPLECTITWADYSPELAEVAADPYSGVNLQIRANMGEYRGNDKIDDRLLRIDLSGRFLSNSLGTFSSGEYERESMLAVDFVSERWGDVEFLAVGINPPILRLRGRDLLANMRTNLGL